MADRDDACHERTAARGQAEIGSRIQIKLFAQTFKINGSFPIRRDLLWFIGLQGNCIQKKKVLNKESYRPLQPSLDGNYCGAQAIRKIFFGALDCRKLTDDIPSDQ